MKSNYAQIIEQNLTRLFSRDLNERSYAMAAQLVDGEMVFEAFGDRCRISANGITMDDREETGPMGIILFMPIDGLADVGEYTSRKILEMVRL